MPANSNGTIGQSFPSRFEYMEDTPSIEGTGGFEVINHVAPPKSSSFFQDFGMDGGFQKKSSSISSKVQVKLFCYHFLSIWLNDVPLSFSNGDFLIFFLK